jgi:chitinase
MDYIITGKAPAGTKYKLRQPGGYPGFLGMMLWTLNYDRYDG